MGKTKLYFVSIDKKVENETIRRVKPKGILLSYYYFKNKNIRDWIEKIGYKPDIILDSGAFSAWTQGKEINLKNYMEYIKEFEDCIEKYIILDEIGKPKETYENYKIMKKNGLNPVPVFHIGSDFKYMDTYKKHDEDFIALGGVAKLKNKTLIRNWVNQLCQKYPNIKFHLLGNTSPKVINNCPIYSADSSAYIIGAVFGNPKHISGNEFEDKVKRAKYNMVKSIKSVVKRENYLFQQTLF